PHLLRTKETDKSNERAAPGPLTTRPCVSMGFCFQQNGQRKPQGLRVQTEAVPATPRKGRRPGAVPFGPWPGLLERLCVVAPVFFWASVWQTRVANVWQAPVGNMLNRKG